MKRRYILANVGILAGCALIFATSATLMWFSNNISIVPTQIEASSEAAYYASGKGTKEDPYVINKARHLYNLAWLQYLGTYNKDEDGDDAVDVTYFSIEGTEDTYGNSVLNMDGWVLPPIGTEDNPFVGIINGNNTIIKNLTVSNTFSDYGTKHPYYDASGNELNENTFTKPSIIGFFGVIGGIDETKTYAYSSIEDVELVENLYLDNITIQNVNDSSNGDKKVLAGLLAGYVNAPIKNSGVGYGEFNFASGTTNLASTVGASNISKVSEYSLIGAYNPSKFSWEGKAGSSGDGGDWGSSIDMMNLTQRINYIQAVTNQGVSDSVFYSDIYNLYDKSLTASERKWDTAQTTYYHMFSGTYLPLSIDTSKAFTTEIEHSAGNGNSFHTTQYYIDNNTSEKNGEYGIINDNNAGYLVGGGNLTSSGGMDNTNPKGRGYVTLRFQNVSNWLSGSFDSATSYDGTTAKIYSVDTRNGNTSTQISSNNYSTDFGYSNFETVKSNFDSLHNGKTTMYGFHFYPMTETDDDFKNSEMVKVKIYGKEYSSYQFLLGTLNFTVKSKGIITTLLASSYSNYDAMFDLFKLERDSDNKIISVNRIKKIYQNTNGGYVYDMDGSDDVDTSGMTLLFDFEQVTGENNYLKNSKSLYYFEIPVTPGDYAIGKSINTVSLIYNSSTRAYNENKGAGANILYLDIGANAGDSGGDSGDEKTSEIDFVYYDNKKLKKITDTGYTNSKVLFDLGGSASGLIAFKRTYENSSSIVYYYPLTSSGITIIGSESNASGTDTKFDKN